MKIYMMFKLKTITKKMKGIKYILLAVIAVLSASYVMADQKITIRCEETGKEMTFTAPDGLRIYEYNANWLDSIPYLLEHARNHEPWAYENLGRCYRYGIGVDKCITNAIIYYNKSDIDANNLAEEAYASDPTDEFGLMNHMMMEIDQNSMTVDKAVALLDSLPGSLPDWAACMKTIFNNRDTEDIEGFIRSTIDLKSISGDELLTSIACLMLLKPEAIPYYSKAPSPEFMEKLTTVAPKIPRLYAMAGDKYWSLYEDCPDNEDALRNAFDMYHKAYLHALLDMSDAVAVLDYRDENPLYEGFPFSLEELARLDSMYSKEFRDELKEPCVVEEVVVEEVVEDD